MEIYMNFFQGSDIRIMLYRMLTRPPGPFYPPSPRNSAFVLFGFRALDPRCPVHPRENMRSFFPLSAQLE